eukprot:jgi/Bigna1/134663/aug1.26_g9371
MEPENVRMRSPPQTPKEQADNIPVLPARFSRSSRKLSLHSRQQEKQQQQQQQEEEQQQQQPQQQQQKKKKKKKKRQKKKKKQQRRQVSKDTALLSPSLMLLSPNLTLAATSRRTLPRTPSESSTNVSTLHFRSKGSESKEAAGEEMPPLILAETPTRNSTSIPYFPSSPAAAAGTIKDNAVSLELSNASSNLSLRNNKEFAMGKEGKLAAAAAAAASAAGGGGGGIKLVSTPIRGSTNNSYSVATTPAEPGNEALSLECIAQRTPAEPGNDDPAAAAAASSGRIAAESVKPARLFAEPAPPSSTTHYSVVSKDHAGGGEPTGEKKEDASGQRLTLDGSQS